jgi:hypothetical protein
LEDVTPAQFRSALKKLDVSQVKIAEALGIGQRTARRYAAGDAEIPEPVAIILRLLVAGKIKLEDLR